MPSSRNYGLLVEKEMIEALNKKRYMNLSPNLKTFIRDMFGVVKPLEKIKCAKCEEYIKPDIVVSIKNRKRYVSIKSGKASTMHCELICTVVPYFRSIGISEKNLKTLCLYQFGDGTYDGSGKYRLDYHETFRWLADKIRVFNDEVNENMEIVLKIVKKFLFQGVKNDTPMVDYIYAGDIDFGCAVSRTQINTHLKIKSYCFYENIHIGPLLIRPHAKYAHAKIRSEYSHQRVDFYWPKFEEDVKYIYKRYNNPDSQ